MTTRLCPPGLLHGLSRMQDELQCSETGEPLWDVWAHGVTQSTCSLHILATQNHRPSLSVLPSNGPRLAIQKHLKQNTKDRRWDVCKMMALWWSACVSHKAPQPLHWKIRPMPAIYWTWTKFQALDRFSLTRKESWEGEETFPRSQGVLGL